MHTIDEQWRKFSDLVVPKDACEAQVSSMKSAFYAGATAILLMQEHLMDTADDDTSVEAIGTWFDEIESFVGNNFRNYALRSSTAH